MTEPAAPADAVVLAIQTGSQVPLQMGVVLELDGRPDAGTLGDLVVRRAGAVPQLCRAAVRQPLRRLRWRPVADIADRVTIVDAEPGEDLVDRATRTVLEPLSPDRPMWRVVVVRGRHTAVIVVLNHAVADGLAGVQVLGRLLDGPADPPRVSGPDPAPGSRRPRMPRAPTRWALVAAMRAGGGIHPRRAEPCSLLAPTGSRRRSEVVDVDLATVRAAAHAAGGSVNDALLAVVAGALEELLETRGEHIRTLAVGVPMATGPRERTAGNANAPLLVEIPLGAAPRERIRVAAAAVASRRASEPPAAPITLLRPVVPLLVRLGLYRRYLRRQRRLHTIVSMVRGPAGPVTLGGVPVTRMIPLALGDQGSITVTVVALAALGRLVVTIHADPDRTPDLDRLAESVRAGFDALVNLDARGAETTWSGR
ncbi:MAG: DUF1298 domain-containing protein [Pseudonocardia sp.]|uniref:wax ester/triacylglycerol synthase domain-containing protein n=1 Tax=Pseudonocardia sp. TaxID=60912 RepID=UPI000869214B|nr:wax ester/triacylglycerol synthase domain-containing protein [Pseudonocardia sp.]MBN9110763.1 DUF1298 domain-containing protein [Pseudonocardia sp.]ODU27136.1 MAG: hypothetical protein ABS80_04670 [Pseudonocardia sp. SCN 72-51]